MSGFVADIAIENAEARAWVRRASELLVGTLREAGVDVDAAEFVRDSLDDVDPWPWEAWRWTVRHSASGALIFWDVRTEEELVKLQVGTHYDSSDRSSPLIGLHVHGPNIHGEKSVITGEGFPDRGEVHVRGLVLRRNGSCYGNLPDAVRLHFEACLLASPRMIAIIESHRENFGRGFSHEHSLESCDEGTVVDFVRIFAQIFLYMTQHPPDATT